MLGWELVCGDCYYRFDITKSREITGERPFFFKMEVFG